MKINFFRTNMEYGNIREKARELNGTARKIFRENVPKLTVKFIASSLYQ